MSEARFREAIADAVPDAPGYRDRAGRSETDARLRAWIRDEIAGLRDKLAELKTSAEEEGEEDMLVELDRIDARMERTIGALESEDHAGAPFFTADCDDAQIDAVCAYDLAILEDVALLVNDTMALKYETIGNLTLRECEGTLAAIELKIANRKDILEESGRS